MCTLPVGSSACGLLGFAVSEACVEACTGHLALPVSMMSTCVYLCASFTPQELQPAIHQVLGWAGLGCNGDRSKCKSRSSLSRYLGVGETDKIDK